MGTTHCVIIIILLFIGTCTTQGGPRRGRRFRRRLMLSVSNLEKRVEMLTSSEHDKCEPLTNPMCKDALPYNHSMYPNLLGHSSEAEAALESAQFSPLVRLKCSDVLGLFLCLVYHPPCMDFQMTIPPCRELCDDARAGCEPVLKQYGYDWPQRLSCELFPLSGQEGTMCMSPFEPMTTTPEATTPEMTTPVATTPMATITNITLFGVESGTNCQCTCGP